MKRTRFRGRKRIFYSGGIGRYGPYALIGYKRGKYVAKTSIGTLGHMISGSRKITKNTRIGLTHNFTNKSTNIDITRKKHRPRRY